jgi:Mg2+ and Co2+ transporter CorA
MLQAINEQLNEQATNPESDSSYVHIIKSIANNQYDALKAIEDQVYKLEYDLAG